MADFDDIEQVVKFVAQLDTQSAQKLTAELNKLNSERIDAVMASETKITDIQVQEQAKRIALASKELDDLEDKLVSKTDKELEQIKRVMDANEARYKFVVDKAREAAQAQSDITKALTEKELDQYKNYLQNRDVLHKRQADVEKERNQEAPAANQGLGAGAVYGAMGKGVGFMASMLPANTEQEKQTKLMAETASNVLSSKTPVEALVNVVKGGIQMWELARKEDARRGEAILGAMGGTMLWGRSPSGSNKEQFEELKATMSILEDTLPQKFRGEVSKTMEALIASNQGVRPGSLQTKGDALVPMFNDLAISATLLGKNWSDFAKMTGELARKEGETIDDAFNSIHVAMATAQRISEQVGDGGIDIRKFVDTVTQAQEALRPFGYMMYDTTALVSKFAKELDRGIISLNDLVSWATGITKTEDSSKAFLFQQMQRQLGGQAGFGELNQVLGAVGRDPRQQSFALEALSQGNIEQLKLLGLSAQTAEKAVGQFQQGVQQTLVQFSATNAGGQSAFGQAANVDFLRRQFVDPALVGMGTQGMTIQARQALRNQGFGGQAPIPTVDQANEILDPQRAAIAESILDIRDKQKGFFTSMLGMGPGGWWTPGFHGGMTGAMGGGNFSRFTPGMAPPQPVALPPPPPPGFSFGTDFQQTYLDVSPLGQDILNLDNVAISGQTGPARAMSKILEQVDQRTGKIPADKIMKDMPFLTEPSFLKSHQDIIKLIDPSILQTQGRDQKAEEAKQQLQKILEAGKVAALDINMNIQGDLSDPKFQAGLKDMVASYTRDYLQKEQDDPISRATKKLSQDFTTQGGSPSIG